MNIAEKQARLRLLRCPGIGPSTFTRLLDRFGEAGKAIEALPGLAQKGGRKSALVPPSIQDIETEWQATLELGADFLFLGSKEYPYLLSMIPDPPPILIYRGFKDLLHKPILAIVGSRNASINSKRLANRFAQVLGENGFIIASGLAKGIDSAAHEGALDTGTIGVIAGGIDSIYPKENRSLYDALYNRGLVLTEYPIGSAPQSRQFPKRNRIITGISQGVLVVEAGLKSGTLISAEYALEQGRDVFAVPGSPLDARNRGANDLIRQGAILTETPDDIFNNLRPIDHLETETRDFKTPLHADLEATDIQRSLVLEAIGDSPLNIDLLIQETKLPTAIVLSILLELEVAGRIERLSGHRVIKNFDMF